MNYETLIKWEHKVLPLGNHPDNQQVQLKQYGEDGWELVTVAVTRFNYGDFAVAYLKRPFVVQPRPLKLIPKDGA